MKQPDLVSVTTYRFRWLNVGLFCALIASEHHDEINHISDLWVITF